MKCIKFTVIIAIIFCGIQLALARWQDRFCDDNNVPNGERFPDPEFCFAFYICMNGEMLENDCPDDHNFNQNTLLCERDYEDCPNDMPVWPRPETSPPPSEFPTCAPQ
jgi:hypothetical protein